MGVPYTFATATTSIPLSQLDANFNTPVTIGSTTVGLGNTTTSLVGLSNVSTTALTVTNDASISGLTVGKGGGSDVNSTVVGNSALSAQTSGVNNTAMGINALHANTTGSSQVAFGYYAAATSTTANDNSAFGSQALYLNTTGSQNTAIGRYALNSNTTASNNTAVGYQAGYSQTTNSNSTFLGYQAGYLSTSSNSVFCGILAGYNTTGTTNAFFGYGAGNAVTSGTNNTIIGSYNGNQGGLDIRTASNYIVLSDGAGNPSAYCDNNKSWVLNSASANSNTFTVKSAQASSSFYVASGSFSSGTAYFGYFVYNGSAVGQITSTGSTTLFTSLSDQRLKENIVDAGSGLAKLSNVKVRSFDWKTNQEKTDFGLIAQELNEVAPEAVVAGVDKEDGSIDKPWQVDSSVLVPAMIKAIQEQQALITDLQARLTKAGL